MKLFGWNLPLISEKQEWLIWAFFIKSEASKTAEIKLEEALTKLLNCIAKIKDL